MLIYEGKNKNDHAYATSGKLYSRSIWSTRRDSKLCGTHYRKKTTWMTWIPSRTKIMMVTLLGMMAFNKYEGQNNVVQDMKRRRNSFSIIVTRKKTMQIDATTWLKMQICKRMKIKDNNKKGGEPFSPIIIHPLMCMLKLF